jgi:hypothetical protein
MAATQLRNAAPRYLSQRARAELLFETLTSRYEEADAIRIRSQAHAFEGKLFVLASTSLMDEDCVSTNCLTADDRAQFQGTDFALTGIFGPD